MAYDAPEGCVRYVCNENLDDIKAKDDIAVEAAKANH